MPERMNRDRPAPGQLRAVPQRDLLRHRAGGKEHRRLGPEQPGHPLFELVTGPSP